MLFKPNSVRSAHCAVSYNMFMCWPDLIAEMWASNYSGLITSSSGYLPGSFLSSSLGAIALTGRAVTLGRGAQRGGCSSWTDTRPGAQLHRPINWHTVIVLHLTFQLLSPLWETTRRLRAMEAPACRAAKFASSPLPHFSSLQRGRHVSPTWDTHAHTYTPCNREICH